MLHGLVLDPLMEGRGREWRKRMKERLGEREKDSIQVPGRIYFIIAGCRILYVLIA